MTAELKQRAMSNLLGLKANPYPGRGILTGLSEDGKSFLQVYWIMGRSTGSRNRIFVDDGNGRLRTDYADKSKKSTDPNIIYLAMEEKNSIYVVSNGHQTEGILQALCEDVSHGLAIEDWEYEPDVPNFTPRITSSFVRFNEEKWGYFDISIIKKSPLGNRSDRQIFSYEDLSEGLGYCITTYQGDGNPLPSFVGEPYLLPLIGSAELVAVNIWENLNVENRVALAVKAINLEKETSSINIINKY